MPCGAPLSNTRVSLSGGLLAIFLAGPAHLTQAIPVARHKIQALLSSRSGEPGGSGCVVSTAELLGLGPPAQLSGMGSLSDFVCDCRHPRERIAFGDTRYRLSRTIFGLHYIL